MKYKITFNKISSKRNLSLTVNLPDDTEFTAAADILEAKAHLKYGDVVFQKIEQVHEDYTLTSPLYTADSMMGMIVQNCMNMYPFLYGNNEYSHLEILEQIFCTIGNGIKFNKDGVLVEDCWDDSSGKMRKTILGEKVFDKRPNYDEEVIKYDNYRKHILDSKLGPLARHVSLYPLGRDYSLIFKIPSNAESSIIDGAATLIHFLMERPVWHNSAYMSEILLNKQRKNKLNAVLCDGMKYRTILEEAKIDLAIQRRANCSDAAYAVINKHYEPDCILPPQHWNYQGDNQ